MRFFGLPGFCETRSLSTSGSAAVGIARCRSVRLPRWQGRAEWPRVADMLVCCPERGMRCGVAFNSACLDQMPPQCLVDAGHNLTPTWCVFIGLWVYRALCFRALSFFGCINQQQTQSGLSRGFDPECKWEIISTRKGSKEIRQGPVRSPNT